MSFIIFSFAFIFTSLNVNIENSGTKKLGEIITEFLHVSIAYNIFTIVLLAISIYIGRKYEQHFLAKAGEILSAVTLMLFIVFTLLSIIQRIISV